MPERLYTFTNPSDIASADQPERVVVINEQLRLRPLDSYSQSKYDRFGRRHTVIITLPELRAEAISELYGFYSELDENDGLVGFQLSNDGGATFYRWDGAAWVSDGGYSSHEEIEEGLTSFELPSPKRILIRMRIDPSTDGFNGPEIRSVCLHYELEYQWEEDLLRSFKHYLEQNFNYSGIARVELSAKSKVAIEPPVVPANPAKAFNLTDDPAREANLASGVSGQDVLLSSAQTGTVEVRFRAKPKIFITAEDSLEVSQTPSVVIGITSLSENRSVRTNERKVDWRRTDKTSRLRSPPVLDDAQIRIQCQAPLERESEAMVEAMATVLQYGRTFDSDATGETFTVKSFSPIEVGDVIGDGLYVRSATLLLSARHWLAVPYTETPLAEEIHFKTFLIDPNETGG